MQERIGVVGLGYVGLPLVLAIAREFPGTVGFDIDAARVEALRAGVDATQEVDGAALAASTAEFAHVLGALAGCSVFIVTVPTPVDANRQPDLSLVVAASEMLGPLLRPGALVVYESTVHPGVTEEICGPALERTSGLRSGRDFHLGYSPERINPGDRVNTVERIVKVVAGQDPATLDRVARIYEAFVSAGVHRAPTIKVAEAAKVIENTQRDVNIALMNELALIFDRIGVRTADVLAAARTKWNFLPFAPGLVGGHCIGVDPYYLMSKAESVGYHPAIIGAGRRINDAMGVHVAQKVIKLLIQAERSVQRARVGVLGLTFKENVPDLRNSRVPDILRELRAFGVHPMVHDPWVTAEDAERTYGLTLTPWEELSALDALVLAVPHHRFAELGVPALLATLTAGGIVADVKSMLRPDAVPPTFTYWSL